MDGSETLRILNALANGMDPASGQRFAADSAYQHPDTVRALFAAVRAVEGSLPATTDNTRMEVAKKVAPRREAGSRWTPEEEARLAAGFDAGKTMAELARLHGRSRAGIEARLLKLGKIDISALTIPLRFGAHTGDGRAQEERAEYRAR